MASVRFTDVQARPMEFLDLTSLTLDEFQLLVPPFEAAFHAHMAVWRLDGKPRTARQFSVFQKCPLPPPEDRLVPLATAATSPLLRMTAPSGRSSAHKTLLHRRHVTAARKKTIRSKMSC